jgi:hypothetical protein
MFVCILNCCFHHQADIRSLLPGERDQAVRALLVRLELGRPLLCKEWHRQANCQGVALQAINAFRGTTWTLKIDLLGAFRGIESKWLPTYGIVLAILTHHVLLAFETHSPFLSRGTFDSASSYREDLTDQVPSRVLAASAGLAEGSNAKPSSTSNVMSTFLVNLPMDLDFPVALLEGVVGVDTSDGELNEKAAELQQPVGFDDPIAVVKV